MDPGIIEILSCFIYFAVGDVFWFHFTQEIHLNGIYNFQFPTVR